MLFKVLKRLNNDTILKSAFKQYKEELCNNNCFNMSPAPTVRKFGKQDFMLCLSTEILVSVIIYFENKKMDDSIEVKNYI